MVEILGSHLLTTIVFLPVAGALVLIFIPARLRTEIRIVSLGFTLAELVLCALAYAVIDGSGDFELTERVAWIPAQSIGYCVGVDGASMLLLLLTAFLSVVSVIASWREIDRRVKEFHILLLLLVSGMLGTFVALDVFLFYVFLELTLIPMYFIIGIWGSGDKVRVAIKFVLFTMFGSAILLVAILYAAGVTGTFDLVAWYAHKFGLKEQLWLFTAFALAFGVKLPLIGLHSWLPEAHSEAPTAGSVLLAGVLLKIGGYGFYRFAMPLFPGAVQAFSMILLVLAVVGIIGGALIATVQPDLKRLIAYSSVSHMGFVVLGLFALDADAAAGSVLLMVCHGLTTGALFLLTGMLSSRRGSRLIDDYGGAARAVPILSVFFVFVALSSMGLPGLANFPGEFLVLLGSFQTKTIFASVAIVGVTLVAVYMLWAVGRVFFGPLEKQDVKQMSDLSFREYSVLIPVAVLTIAIGIWPQRWIAKSLKSAEAFVKLAGRIEMMASSNKKTKDVRHPNVRIPGYPN